LSDVHIFYILAGFAPFYFCPELSLRTILTYLKSGNTRQIRCFYAYFTSHLIYKIIINGRLSPISYILVLAKSGLGKRFEMTQNRQTKMTDESPVYVDEANLFHSIEGETTRLREELETERDKLLRLAAEYENYRRRTKHESARAAEEGKRELLERLISLADDLDLALANADKSPDADPERHEAFDVVSGTKNEPETVYAEIRRGYFWNDKLLRPALVVVAQ
jgi:molecular chaperone GrpE (heat shock protein)